MSKKPEKENEQTTVSELGDPPCSAVDAAYDIEEALLEVAMLTGMAIHDIRYAVSQPHNERRFIGRIRGKASDMANAVEILSDRCHEFLKQNDHE